MKVTKIILNIAIEVLNEGLRPHLTIWQAKFRRWYTAESEKNDNIGISPQELQKRYPEYLQLIKEMEKVNQKLINYRHTLKNIALED